MMNGGLESRDRGTRAAGLAAAPTPPVLREASEIAVAAIAAAKAVQRRTLECAIDAVDALTAWCGGASGGGISGGGAAGGSGAGTMGGALMRRGRGAGGGGASGLWGGGDPLKGSRKMWVAGLMVVALISLLNTSHMRDFKKDDVAPFVTSLASSEAQLAQQVRAQAGAVSELAERAQQQVQLLGALLKRTEALEGALGRLADGRERELRLQRAIIDGLKARVQQLQQDVAAARAAPVTTAATAQLPLISPLSPFPFAHLLQEEVASARATGTTTAMHNPLFPPIPPLSPPLFCSPQLRLQRAIIDGLKARVQQLQQEVAAAHASHASTASTATVSTASRTTSAATEGRAAGTRGEQQQQQQQKQQEGEEHGKGEAEGQGEGEGKEQEQEGRGEEESQRQQQEEGGQGHQEGGQGQQEQDGGAGGEEQRGVKEEGGMVREARGEDLELIGRDEVHIASPQQPLQQWAWPLCLHATSPSPSPTACTSLQCVAPFHHVPATSSPSTMSPPPPLLLPCPRHLLSFYHVPATSSPTLPTLVPLTPTHSLAFTPSQSHSFPLPFHSSPPLSPTPSTSHSWLPPDGSPLAPVRGAVSTVFPSHPPEAPMETVVLRCSFAPPAAPGEGEKQRGEGEGALPLGGRVAAVMAGGMTVPLIREQHLFDKSPPTTTTTFPPPFPSHLTLCLPPLHGPSISPRALLEFLSYHRLIGITSFLLYNAGGATDPVRAVIHAQAEQGRVETGQGTAQAGQGRAELVEMAGLLEREQLWNHGQVPALHDCLYRSRMAARWVLYLDLDDYLWLPPVTEPRPLPPLHILLETYDAVLGLPDPSAPGMAAGGDTATAGGVDAGGGRLWRGGVVRDKKVPKESQWGGEREGEMQVERFVFHWPEPACHDNEKDGERIFDPSLCPGEQGHRKFIVDPRRVDSMVVFGPIPSHPTYSRMAHVSTSDLQLLHYRELGSGTAQGVCDEPTPRWRTVGWWHTDASYARSIAALRQRAQCNFTSGGVSWA
ncbi:unnamed protein product [Closterium sp. NIES-64]|nr:unnamed protein product [Closterium sp. NIES-64]